MIIRFIIDSGSVTNHEHLFLVKKKSGQMLFFVVVWQPFKWHCQLIGFVSLPFSTGWASLMEN